MLECVEIFKGVNSLFNGVVSSGVGGMINFELKWVEDLLIVCVGVDYIFDFQVGGIFDLGCCFGDNNQFGVWVNLVYCEGEGVIDNDKCCIMLVLLGFDYCGDCFCFLFDFGYQKKMFYGGMMGVNISGVDFILVLLDNSKNYSQKWGYSDIESEFGMVKVEYDLIDSWMVYSVFGGQYLYEIGIYSVLKFLNKNGDVMVGCLDINCIIDVISGMGGVCGDFNIGVILYKVNFGYVVQVYIDVIVWWMLVRNLIINIYDNYDVVMLDNVYFGGNYYDLLVILCSCMQGWLLSDIFGFFNDKVLFIVVVCYQKVVVCNYSNVIGLEDIFLCYI